MKCMISLVSLSDGLIAAILGGKKLANNQQKSVLKKRIDGVRTHI